MNKVLVVVDMQKDFIDGSLGSKEALAIVDNVVKEINDLEYNQIIYTMDLHDEDYLETLEGKNLPIKHCIENSEGFFLNDRVNEALKNRQKDIETKINCLYKRTFGTFEFKDYINDDVLSITICGLCSDICVISNALILRALYKDVPMYYVKDACAGTSIEAHKAALKIMESCQIYKKKQ